MPEDFEQMVPDKAAHEGAPDKPRTNWRTILRLTVWGGLAFVLLLLILQNGDQTQVNFLVWEVWLPKFLLILVCALLGAVVGGAWVWLMHRRGRRRADS